MYLAIEVHKEFGDIARSIVEGSKDKLSQQKRALLKNIKPRLEIFDLDWWIVAAFGVLMVVIMASGYLGSLSNLVKNAPLGCSCQLTSSGLASCDTSSADQVRLAMSLYATLIGLLIGFKIGWARLKIARGLRDC
jgi:hypothetical protein